MKDVVEYDTRVMGLKEGKATNRETWKRRIHGPINPSKRKNVRNTNYICVSLFVYSGCTPSLLELCFPKSRIPISLKGASPQIKKRDEPSFANSDLKPNVNH